MICWPSLRPAAAGRPAPPRGVRAAGAAARTGVVAAVPPSPRSPSVGGVLPSHPIPYAGGRLSGVVVSPRDRASDRGTETELNEECPDGIRGDGSSGRRPAGGGRHRSLERTSCIFNVADCLDRITCCPGRRGLGPGERCCPTTLAPRTGRVDDQPR